MSEQSTNQLVNFDIKQAVKLGKEQVIDSEYKGIPVYIVPDNMKLVALNDLVNEQLKRPYSLKQSVELLTVESFIEYYNRFATDSSTVFVNDKTSTFTAILDYHDSPNEPAWKRHTATYKCPVTKEWNNWITKNNERMSQEEFALFIEDNIKEIAEPNGAEMLEIATSLKAANNVDFKSAVRLDNGQVQFTYHQTISGQAGESGQLSIPETITLLLQPFMLGSAYELTARFRYRITQQGLVMWYTIIRPHAFIDDAFKDVVEKVKSEISLGQVIHAISPV